MALKVLHVEVEGNEEIVRRFVRESKAIALLKHPNIVASIDGPARGPPYLRWSAPSATPRALMKREKPPPLGARSTSPCC